MVSHFGSHILLVNDRDLLLLATVHLLDANPLVECVGDSPQESVVAPLSFSCGNPRLNVAEDFVDLVEGSVVQFLNIFFHVLVVDLVADLESAGVVVESHRLVNHRHVVQFLVSVVPQTHVFIFVQTQDLEVLGVHEPLVFVERDVDLARDARNQLEVRVAWALNDLHHFSVHTLHQHWLDSIRTRVKAECFLTPGMMFLLSILNSLVVELLDVGLKDLEQHAGSEHPWHDFRDFLDLEVLRMQFVLLLLLQVGGVAEDLLTSQFAAVHIEVEVGGSA